MLYHMYSNNHLYLLCMHKYDSNVGTFNHIIDVIIV